VENIPFQAERHSARRQKPFAFPPESAFTFRPECCSGSQRNRVRLHSGIAFTFDRIPHLLLKLGGSIKRLRKRGLHADDLAVHLDMSRGHLSDIERGKREAGIITLQVIARGLDTTMANLLKGL
jgi:hypothetical protein